MKLIIKGYCSGTKQRNSKSTGKPFFVTEFMEVGAGGFNKVSVFGDLGLPVTDKIQEYTIDGNCQTFNGKNISGG